MLRAIARSLLVLILLAGVVRLGLFLAYLYYRVPGTGVEMYHLESKMVHLAWRVQAGVRLYPDWRTYPHVANFFGPLYFVAVGLIGRMAGASLEGLYLVGRLVSVGSAFLTALVLGLDAGRRYGRWAGVMAGVMSLGVAPLYGYGSMTRPDALADLLGLGGYLLAARLGRRGVIAGGVLLGLAILTKQTCGMYLLAAAIALALEGRRRAALGLVAGVGGSVALVAAAITALIEPNFAPNLLAEGQTPWSYGSWAGTGAAS